MSVTPASFIIEYPELGSSQRLLSPPPYPRVCQGSGSVPGCLVSAAVDSSEKVKAQCSAHTPAGCTDPLSWHLCAKSNDITFHAGNFSIPPPFFFALSLLSIFSLSGLSHTCSWQLRDQELWCCKGYFISGNSHQFLPYCVGYPRTPRVSNAFVW